MSVGKIDTEVRIKWIKLLFEAAKEKGIEFPLSFSRGVEHELYFNRGKAIQLAEEVSVHRYGDVDVLDVDSEASHINACNLNYLKNIRRIICALHLKTSKFISQKPQDWIDAKDDVFHEHSLHSEWEQKFYERQDLSRKILSDKKSSEVKGIFSCSRCKSFDVDTEQKQTRGSDEPMTIFCTCNVCGKRFIR